MQPNQTKKNILKIHKLLYFKIQGLTVDEYFNDCHDSACVVFHFFYINLLATHSLSLEIKYKEIKERKNKFKINFCFDYAYKIFNYKHVFLNV